MKLFLEHLKSRKLEFEKFLVEEIYPELQKKFHPILAEACIYSLNAGGKRIRPILAIESYLSHQDSTLHKNVLYIASALECIHTYSLIHDDLPSMDDDDFRRGIPTLHKKFSESTAILAGDALNSYAFYLLSKISSDEKNLIPDLLEILHTGSGGSGMISGQIEDLYLENNPDKFSIEALESIHEKKTGALILSSILLGNRLHKNYLDKEKKFSEYGKDLGLLFQIADDIIDIEGTFEEIGKTPGKDAAKGKLTFVNLYGIEKSKMIRDELKNKLINLSDSLNFSEFNFFLKLPEYIADRKN